MKSIFTTLLLIIISQLSAQTGPKKLWSVCFSDTATGTAFENDMATDTHGNTYITGYLQETAENNYNLTHFYIVKNNAAGVQQWVRYFPSDSMPVSRYNAGKAVVLDANGNVYVAGATYDTACNVCTIQKPHEDAFTIKYTAAGNLVWINRYAGPDSTFQTAADITTDAGKNVYVVGSEMEYNKSTATYSGKMFTQKIRPNGSNAWVEKINGTVGNAIAVDVSGNILIGGAYDPSNEYPLQSPEVIVYNSNGDSLWTRTFSEKGKNGTIYSIGSDSEGNIYANGQTDTLTYNDDPKVITLKYSPSGNLLWHQKEADYTTTNPHIYGDFTVDKNGNAYSAASLGNSDFDNSKWLVSKYNSSGTLLWSTIYNDSVNTEDNPTAIVTDNSSNVYVTGNSYVASKNNESFTTIMYNANGTQQWVAFYGASKKSSAYANSTGIDAMQNIYVSGISLGGICTIKYKQSTAVQASEIAALKSVENSSNNVFTVYPNPCKDVLHFTNTSLNGNYSFSVSDLTGRIITAPADLYFVKGSTGAIKVQQLSAGIYLLRLTNKVNNYTIKFMKE